MLKEDGIRMDDCDFAARLVAHPEMLGSTGLNSAPGSADIWLVASDTPGNTKCLLQKQKQKSTPSQHLQVSQRTVQQELTILPSLLSAVNTACCTEPHRPYSI